MRSVKAAQLSANMAVSDIAELLAKRSVAMGMLRSAEKQADLSGILDQAKNYGNKAKDWLLAPGHETALYGLGGVAAGGLVGGLASLGRDPEDRNTSGSMLTGALAGGAMGVGGGLVAPHIKEYYRNWQNSHKAAPHAAPKVPGPVDNMSPDEINKQLAEMRENEDTAPWLRRRGENAVNTLRDPLSLAGPAVAIGSVAAAQKIPGLRVNKDNLAAIAKDPAINDFGQGMLKDFEVNMPFGRRMRATWQAYSPLNWWNHRGAPPLTPDELAANPNPNRDIWKRGPEPAPVPEPAARSIPGERNPAMGPRPGWLHEQPPAHGSGNILLPDPNVAGPRAQAELDRLLGVPAKPTPAPHVPLPPEPHAQYGGWGGRPNPEVPAMTNTQMRQAVKGKLHSPGKVAITSILLAPLLLNYLRHAHSDK